VYRRALANPESPRSPYVVNAIQTVEQLRVLKGLLCKDGKVEFISCSSFACHEGRELHGDLEGIFGEGNVQGYAYPVKWGLFGTVYQITATKPPLFGDINETVEKLPVLPRP
jgi:hypothetical protein